MEDRDIHQIFIKTEVEDVTENGVPNSKSIISEVRELDKKDNLTEVKFEYVQGSGDVNDEHLLATKCKLDMDVETYDEFRNLDTRSNANKKSLYECGLCNYITNYESDLRQHQIKHTFTRSHRGRFRAISNSCQKSRQETHHESKKCDRDDFDHTYARSINPNELNTNLTKGEEVTHNDLFASRTDTATKKSKNENQLYKCDQCDHKTHRKAYMRKHKQRHWVVKLFQCHICYFQSNSESNFQRHRLSHKDKYKCVKCNYTTVNRGLMRCHLFRHEEKTFKCDNCSFKTKTKEYLQRHQHVHTQERPFQYGIYYAAIRRD